MILSCSLKKKQKKTCEYCETSDCYHFTSMIWTGVDILIHGLGVAVLRVMVFAPFPCCFPVQDSN